MAPTLGGWVGRVADIDLTTGEARDVDCEQTLRKYLGGQGFGQSVILDQVAPETSAFDPENVVVIGVGPLTGTGAPASGRLSIDTVNVLTGGMNSCNAGGHFGPELKYAGFDALIIRGRAPKPVWIEIVDGRIRLHDASHLWGQMTLHTEDVIRAEMGDKYARVLSIGPAGENLVGAACVIIDRARAAARGGVGAVLGSKHLKAIGVRGHQPIRVARPAEFAAEAAKARAMNNNDGTRTTRKYGLFYSMPTLNKLSRVAYRNFQDDHMDDKRLEAVDPGLIVDRYRVRKLGCFNCAVVCNAYFEVKDGPHAMRGEGLSQNDMENWVSRFDMNDPEALLRIRRVCSELGLDIDNASVAISWAFECYEEELISVLDTGGLELRWGDPDAIIQMLHQLAYRRGFGEVLALGVEKASDIVGPDSKRLAVTCKGQELCETARAAKGWAFGCIVAARGGTHMEGAPRIERWNLSPEYVERKYGHREGGDPRTLNGKPEVVYWTERFKAAVDSLGVCYLNTEWGAIDNMGPENLAALYSAATGIDTSADDLLVIGDRITNLKKALNTLRRGFRRKDDMPPARLVREPIRSGGAKGAHLDAKEWDGALTRYYTLHGWDPESGWQTAAGLHARGMDDVAARLAAAGKLLP